jgi:hypothetical protein
MVDRRKRCQELGNLLHATLRLELLHLLHQLMQTLRHGCDHGQRDIRIFLDAADDMICRYPYYPGIGNSLGRRRKACAGQRGRLGKTITPSKNVNHRFFTGHVEPVMLCPAVDHDEECRRWGALSKQRTARFERHHGRRRNDILDCLRLKTPEKGDAGDDFKVRGRRRHVTSHPRNEDMNDAERLDHDPITYFITVFNRVIRKASREAIIPRRGDSPSREAIFGRCIVRRTVTRMMWWTVPAPSNEVA